MLRGIEISKKHGLNPSMDLCFWCGKPKGLVLFGRVTGDTEAPKETCSGLEPCDACQEQFSKGVWIVEVTENGDRFENNLRFSIKADVESGKADVKSGSKVVWPTGRFVVMKAESIKGGKAGMMMLADTKTMDSIFAREDALRAKTEHDGGRSSGEDVSAGTDSHS